MKPPIASPPVHSPPPPADPAISAGTLLSRTFALWRERLPPLAGISVAFQAAALLVGAAVGSPFLAGGRLGQVSPEAQAFVFTGRYWAMTGIGLVLGMIQVAAVTAGALAHLEGRWSSAGEMVGIGLRRAGPLLGVGLLAFLAIWLGLALLIVPGVILLLMLSLVGPIVVAERLSPSKVFRRSRTLTKGHRWKLLALYLLVYLAAFAPTLAVSTLAGGVPYLATALNLVVSGVMGPLLAVAPAVAYHALRVAAEGAGTAELERVFG